MKEYLKPYLLPKEYAGKNYICQRCNSEMIVGNDGPSGNRRTFGICKKCKTELGRAVQLLLDGKNSFKNTN
jgi:hypothetical protein